MIDLNNVKIEHSWKEILSHEFKSQYFYDIKQKLIDEKDRYKIYPPLSRIFTAFNMTPFNNVKVVILGQDPYHGLNQANGLSFSVSKGIKIPPSLSNIFTEIKNDIGRCLVVDGDLTPWAEQGVLLLNSILTVRANQAGSHSDIGWQKFTDCVILKISQLKSNVVFMLWGNYAKSKANLINGNRHLILQSAHPSPLARGAFFGCRHFSKCNEFLIQSNKTPIIW